MFSYSLLLWFIIDSELSSLCYESDVIVCYLGCRALSAHLKILIYPSFIFLFETINFSSMSVSLFLFIPKVKMLNNKEPGPASKES